MQDLLECIAMCKQLKHMDAQLIELFNNNTGPYDGDPLFQKSTSPICKHWVPRGDEEEELFMNWNCSHPDADCDFGDTDHCCIMSCPDEKHGTQIAGQITKTYSGLHPLTMKLLDIFNDNSHLCEHHNVDRCLKCDEHCCMANCPL